MTDSRASIALHQGSDNTMTAPTPEADLAETKQVSFLEFNILILRHRRFIGGCAVALFLVAMVALLFRDRQYTSSTSFAPQAADRTPGLAGLAAQFGVTAAGPDVTDSPAFYADLFKTRELLTSILQGEYRFATAKGVESAKLIDVLKVRANSEGERIEKAITELTSLLRVELKTRTGVITLHVQLPNPVLAQEVAQRFLDEVSRFNLQNRRSRAGAERRFTEGRIVEIQQELREAEDRLQAFLQRNRDYRNSPDLSFQHDRLAQEVDFRRTVYTTVSQSNERARMDEVRDTPVITIIENPSLPARADGRGLLKFGLIAFILGGLAGVALGFARDVRTHRRRSAVRGPLRGS